MSAPTLSAKGDRPRILLIEDDPTLGPAMLQRLRLEGFEPRLVTDGAAAIKEALSRVPDVILSDMRLPDRTGEDVFRAITEAIGLVPYVFMTAFGDVQQAVRLVKAGARDYLIKPVDTDALVELLSAMSNRAEPSPAQNARPAPLSEPMRAFEGLLVKAAKSALPLLLLGETGVGKERAARLAHDWSAKSSGPFVPLNCAALPRDLAESLLFGHEKGAFTGAVARMDGVVGEADAGTLFLDEVGELPLELQPKLLRLLQERTYRPVGAARERTFNGRLVAATHRDLKAKVAEGAFREDLYFRLAVVELTIPPLRDRHEEIMLLAHRFLNEAVGGAGRLSLSDGACERLRRHPWPGNIRELRNRIERAVALRDGDVIGERDIFPDVMADQVSPKMSVEGSLEAAAEAAIRRKVRDTLAATGGNQSAAARRLNVSRTTIWKYARDES